MILLASGKVRFTDRHTGPTEIPKDVEYVGTFDWIEECNERQNEVFQVINSPTRCPSASGDIPRSFWDAFTLTASIQLIDNAVFDIPQHRLRETPVELLLAWSSWFGSLK